MAAVDGSGSREPAAGSMGSQRGMGESGRSPCHPSAGGLESLAPILCSHPLCSFTSPLDPAHQLAGEKGVGREKGGRDEGMGRAEGQRRRGGETAGSEQGEGRGGEGPRAQTRRPQLPLSAHPPPSPSKITLLLFLRFIFCQKKERPFGLLRYRFMRPLCVSACLCSSREAAGGRAPAGRGTRVLPAAREEGVRPRRGGGPVLSEKPIKGPCSGLQL